MKRLGTVLVFKPGLHKREVVEELAAKIGHLLDDRYFVDSSRGGFTNPAFVQFHVNEFDDKYGGPVWYIP